MHSLHLLTPDSFKTWLPNQSKEDQDWIKLNNFKASAGETLILPSKDVLVGISIPASIWDLGALPFKLPQGTYKIETEHDIQDLTQLCLGWELGAYQFTRYKKQKELKTKLHLPTKVDQAYIEAAKKATFLVRDLINTPANDLGPLELAKEAQKIAKEFKAKFTLIQGDALLKKNYPAVHAVGRASASPPCMIEFKWGNPKHPKITLVGKGVCFDSGGLDIKPSSGMLTMKKDMGGAAHILGLARMIMELKLPLHLHVLIPAVENAISGNAFRPMDIIQTRKGLSVEIGNTDAEGRLILADALYEADQHNPNLIIDFATLTGAARIALGTELPGYFCHDDSLASDITQAQKKAQDPLWRLPLWEGYKKQLEGKISDLSSTGSSGYGGAITAALFLNHFVRPTTPWIHIDVMAWNLSTQAGRPEGGEAMGMRAMFELIKERLIR